MAAETDKNGLQSSFRYESILVYSLSGRQGRSISVPRTWKTSKMRHKFLFSKSVLFNGTVDLLRTHGIGWDEDVRSTGEMTLTGKPKYSEKTTSLSFCPLQITTERSNTGMSEEKLCLLHVESHRKPKSYDYSSSKREERFSYSVCAAYFSSITVT